MIGFLAFCFASVPAWETGRWLVRLGNRRRMFEKAEARALAVQKPLLVIGDPNGGWTHDTHGFGDVCLDMTGCPDAPKGIRCVLGQDRIPLANDSHVVFICYTLELVPNIVHAWREICRVAGGAQNVFLLSLDKKQELAAFSYPGVQWLLDTNANGQLLGANKYYPRFPIRRSFR